MVETIYPEDLNEKQEFIIPETQCQVLSLKIPSSTDFYGRVTIYSFEVYGDEC
jgi:hypothetical protein